MYRPAPIRSGTLVTASVMPVTGVLDGSTVTFQIVEMPDGRFLQVDRASAVVPAGAEFWTISINGRLSLKTTARQGGLNGTRIDPEVYGDAFTVSFNAVTGTEKFSHRPASPNERVSPVEKLRCRRRTPSLRR